MKKTFLQNNPNLFTRQAHSTRLARSGRPQKAGFTLVEVMVAVGLFVVVAITSVTAVLSVTATHKRTREYRQALDTVNFLIEDMARNIRLGANYRCNDNVEDEVTNAVSALNDPQDCPNGASGIVFEGQNGNTSGINANDDQVAYVIAVKDTPGLTMAKKNQNSLDIFNQILPDNVNIDPAGTSFTVIGALPFASTTGGATDTTQPRVIIKISGNVIYKGEPIPFHVQTTVAQRLIDV